MTMHENVSGVWKQIPQAAENVSGTNKQILQGYENVSGVWEQFFASGTVTLSGATISDAGEFPEDDAVARVEFRADGTVWQTEGTTETQLSASTDWLRPADAASSYQIRFTNRTGAAPESSTVAEDSWHSFAAGNFFVQYKQTTVGTSAGQFDIEIRLGTGAALDTATYGMSAVLTDIF